MIPRNRHIRLYAFFVLALLTLTLVFFAMIESVVSWPLLLPVLLILSIGLAAALFHEYKTCCSQSKDCIYASIENIHQIIFLFAGSCLTYFISVNIGLGAVLAAALTGTAAAIISRKRSAAAYCGAFVGMVSQEVSQGFWFLAVATLVSGILFILSSDAINGYGGKLGTIAFGGCLFAAVTFGRSFLSQPVFQRNQIGWITLYSVSSAVLTYVLSVRLKWGPVLASSLIGLTGGILLPLIHSDIGQELAIVVICASFAGMSSKEVVPGEWLVALAGLFTGVIYVFSLPHLGGLGGKLGTIAFASTLAAAGLHAVYKKTDLAGRLSRRRNIH